VTLSRWFAEAWDDALVYALTLLGVLLAQVLPVFKAGADVDLSVTVPRLVVASIIALYLVLQDEDTKGDAIARKGKKTNLRRRCSSAMTNGFTWSTLTGMV